MRINTLRNKLTFAHFAFICVCLAFITPGAWAEELSHKVDAIAQEAIDSKSAVGLSIGVAKGDRIRLAKGYGLANVELQSPASSETVYRIGSITKQFTAAAILMLVEDGKMTLDDPISKYVKEFRDSEEPITIRRLLQHTSGVKSFTDLPSYRQLMRRDVTHAEILSRFADEPLQFSPGERYRYSNSGFYLLGMVIESVTQESYSTFLQQRVLSKIELHATRYDRAATIIPNRAQGYSRWTGELKNARFLSMTQPFSAGALVSTVEDLIRWQRALVNHKLLGEDSYTEMTKRAKLKDGKTANYGLGTVIRNQNGRVTFGHGGGINGFRSSLVYYPDSDVTIVVLANCENTNTSRIASKIAAALLNGD